MQLREWQNRFQDDVLNATSAADFALQPPHPVHLPGMTIYANAYRERLHEALRSNYPALHRLLGDRDFAETAYAFIAAHPPQTASIRWFGDLLADYLNACDPFRECPALAELARFEWALRHTIDAADAERIEARHLQALPAEQWETLVCAAHPSLSVLNFRWNAPQIWRALDAGEEPPSPAVFDSHWFVYRGVDGMSEWRSASADEAEAIRMWSQQKNFGALCESLAEKTGAGDRAVVAAASFMRTWVEQGLLVHPSGGKESC